MRKKGDDSASGLGAEWYKKACAITSTQIFGGRCETETVNRTQQKNKMGKVEIFCKCHTQEGGWYLALDVGPEWYHEECVPIPKQVWRKM